MSMWNDRPVKFNSAFNMAVHAFATMALATLFLFAVLYAVHAFSFQS